MIYLIHTLGGVDGASFGIDRATGQLKTKAALDFETKNVYRVIVTGDRPVGCLGQHECDHQYP